MYRVTPGTGVGLVGEELILGVVLVPKELVLPRVVLGGEELVLLPCQLLPLWQRHESLSVLKKDLIITTIKAKDGGCGIPFLALSWDHGEARHGQT